MATLLDKLAEQLAEDTVRQAALSGDDGLIDAVAKSLEDTSTTFKEAFLTAVRYIKADARVRELLPDFQPDETRALPAPKPKKPASRVAKPEEDDSPTAPEAKKSEATAKAKETDEDEIPYAEAEIVEEDKTVSEPHVGTGRLVPKPKISAEDAETPVVEPEITGPRKAGR